MNGLEIYIHIPFCVKKCDYCDFLSAPADLETKEKYVEALINEIKLNKNKMSEYVVDTVFIGGGTPSLLEENHERPDGGRHRRTGHPESDGDLYAKRLRLFRGKRQI